MIDSSLQLCYHAQGECYVTDFITIDNTRIAFDKRASELIDIHTGYADEKGDSIKRDYHFNDDTHKLSHFYSYKNNQLHGFAVFYNDAGKVERYAYYNNGKMEQPPLAIANELSKCSLKAFSDVPFNGLILKAENRRIYKRKGMQYYKMRDCSVLFMGTLCFIIEKGGVLEAIFTHCRRRDSKLTREGTGYFFNPHSHYLTALSHYRYNMPEGKPILFPTYEHGFDATADRKMR